MISLRVVVYFDASDHLAICCTFSRHLATLCRFFNSHSMKYAF